MAIDDSPSSWLVHCNRGHPVRHLKETERFRQRWNPFTQTECRICGVKIASLKARWQCEHHCSYRICDDCVNRRFKDIAAELASTATDEHSGQLVPSCILRKKADAVPWELRGTKEFNQLRCLISESSATDLSHALGLVLKSAVNVPELLGRTKHQGPRASATILAPAAAGVLCGAPGVAVGLAVGTTAYGVSQKAHQLRHPEGRCDPLVLVEVLNAEQETLAAARSHIAPKTRNPVWNQTLSLPAGEEGEAHHLQQQGWSWRGKNGKSAKLAASLNIAPEKWELNSATVRLTLYDKSVGTGQMIGDLSIPLSSLLVEPEAAGHLVTDTCGEAVLGEVPPYLPCRISLSVVQESLPQNWTLPPCMVVEEFPVHVFMMTRGTRGDVQPFVALARGLAEELGWLVTICTESTHANFVQKHSDVSKGAIRFRPSGGNTEARMDSVGAHFLLSHSTEFLQMIALSRSEAEFFSSATVFMDEVLSLEHSAKPVDLIMFGFTLAGVAALVSERCKKPLIGLILQPSCIPSKQEDWKAIQAIESPEGKSLLDTIEEMAFTSHGSLKVLKDLAEKNPFASMNLNHLRKLFDLEPVANTWQALNDAQVPIIIPMPEGTFQRPQDWSDNIIQTEFIFLRKASVETAAKTLASLGHVGTFIEDARQNKASLCLISFSSMPVPRRSLLRIVLKLIRESKFPIRVIYVGRIEQGPADLETEAQKCKDAMTFCEAKAVDFGILFPWMDCFIVHGGLGTTVEALRAGKPCCVTGPLLMDQRFWGYVCYEKAVGPKPVFITDFEKHCVDFVDAAVDPTDPEKWQETAKGNVQANYWGRVEDDGIEANVHRIRDLWPNLKPLATRRLTEDSAGSSAPTKVWGCCSSSGVSEPAPILQEDEPMETSALHG